MQTNISMDVIAMRHVLLMVLAAGLGNLESGVLGSVAIVKSLIVQAYTGSRQMAPMGWFRSFCEFLI
jgi:hypothetical protein